MYIKKLAHLFFGAWSFFLVRIWVTPSEGSKDFVNLSFLRKQTMKVGPSSHIMEKRPSSMVRLHYPWCKVAVREPTIGMEVSYKRFQAFLLVFFFFFLCKASKVAISNIILFTICIIPIGTCIHVNWFIGAFELVEMTLNIYRQSPSSHAIYFYFIIA